jgi:hypothetical protein
VDTLIFVDIDGVLNVGISDPGNRPLEFSTANYNRAQGSWNSRHESEHRGSIERLISTHSRELGHGEGGTYGKFLSEGSTGLSDALVERLANLLEAAGKNRMVVISSTWRLPQHRARVQRLEDAVSRHMNSRFSFDSRTSLVPDNTPEQRLRTIGDFVQDFCDQRPIDESKDLRILVLEDFHITPLGNWSCEGEMMDGVATVERYIQSRSGHTQAAVKLVHTYDEWKTPEGTLVKVGGGLTLAHICAARNFLGLDCAFCGRPPSPDKVELVMEPEVPGAEEDGVTVKETGEQVVTLPLAAGVAWLRVRNFFAVNSRPVMTVAN